MVVPQCDFGLIGGSSTLSIEFPESLELDYVELKGRDLVLIRPGVKAQNLRNSSYMMNKGIKGPDLLYAWLEAGSKPG